MIYFFVPASDRRTCRCHSVFVTCLIFDPVFPARTDNWLIALPVRSCCGSCCVTGAAADEVSELVPGHVPEQCELSFQLLVPPNCVSLPSSHAKPCPTLCCAFATATRILVSIHSPNTALSPHHDADAVTVRVSSMTLVGNGGEQTVTPAMIQHFALRTTTSFAILRERCLTHIHLVTTFGTFQPTDIANLKKFPLRHSASMADVLLKSWRPSRRRR